MTPTYAFILIAKIVSRYLEAAIRFARVVGANVYGAVILAFSAHGYKPFSALHGDFLQKYLFASGLVGKPDACLLVRRNALRPQRNS